MIIDIYPVVSIHEIQGTTDFMTEENIKIVQDETEKNIKSKVQDLINKFQKDYNSDVLGFQDTFEKEKPKVSENLKKNGIDIFTNLKTIVNVHVQIKGSNKTLKPIIIGK